MIDNRSVPSLFLAVSAAGLVPIALAYGVDPQWSMAWLYSIDATSVAAKHVFRTLMVLYLAFALFWMAGAVRPALRVPALWSLVVFMFGLALGRLFSIALDGYSLHIFAVYTGLEFLLGAIGLGMLRAVPLTAAPELAASAGGSADNR